MAPDSPAGGAAGFTRKEYIDVAFKIFCTLETRRVEVAQHQTPLAVGDTFGKRYDATAEGKRVIEATHGYVFPSTNVVLDGADCET